jgi:N-acetylmuramoyl-L-alanine amidase
MRLRETFLLFHAERPRKTSRISLGLAARATCSARHRQAATPARFCYPQLVRTRKYFASLLAIAAGALLALASFAAQSAPQSNPPSSTQQAAPPSAPTPAPLVVVIDPAHGGADPGAHGSNGIAESDVVLAFARQMRAALQAQGVTAVLTRDADADPSFDDRSAVANAQPHAIFVCLHVASTGTPATVRVYSLPIFAAQAPTQSAAAGLLPPPVELPNPHPGLRAWDNAQAPYLDLSRHFAELLQSQLTQRFRGSPPAPVAAAVRQLRTIAAPAVAIEVSNVMVADRRQLDIIATPLADAVVHAVLAFEPSFPATVVAPAPAANSSATEPAGGH